MALDGAASDEPPVAEALFVLSREERDVLLLFAWADLSYEQIADAPGTAGTLQARLRLPASVRAGTILRYTVTLSNPTETTVVLHPCPGYSEGAYASGLVVRRSFALNCQSVQAIPAHGHVRYAMRLTMPQGAAPAIVKIAWSLNTPTGPSAGRNVQITAG